MPTFAWADKRKARRKRSQMRQQRFNCLLTRCVPFKLQPVIALQVKRQAPSLTGHEPANQIKVRDTLKVNDRWRCDQ